jgi:hypothetical protein
MSGSQTLGPGWMHRLAEQLQVASNARGNGLPAARWVMIADVTPARADALLEALGAADVPARAARIRPRALYGAVTRVWADVDRLARAENVLMAMLAAGDSNGHAPSHMHTVCVDDTDDALFDALMVNRLRSSWGFCTGHAWLYLCVEGEMVGRSAATATIYRDLTRQAVRLLENRHSGRHTRRALAGVEPCLLCDYGTDPAPFEKLVAVALTRGWVARSAAAWAERRCPRCLPGTVPARAVLCRLHAPRRDLRNGRLLSYLAGLEEPLGRCSEAALVQAVGWFAGWHRAAALVGT